MPNALLVGGDGNGRVLSGVDPQKQPRLEITILGPNGRFGLNKYELTGRGDNDTLIYTYVEPGLST